MLPTPSACKNLEKRRTIAVFLGSGSDMALWCVAHCHFCDVYEPQFTSFWVPYDFNTGEVSDVQSGIATPTIAVILMLKMMATGIF